MDQESIYKLIKEQNPEYKMTYEDWLKKYRDEKVPFKTAQKQASDMVKKMQKELDKKAKEQFAKLEAARNELAKTKPSAIKPEVIKPKSDVTETGKKTDVATSTKEEIPEPEPIRQSLIQGIDIDALFDAEDQIRKAGANRNTIIRIGSQAIPNGQLVDHGKDGVNTLVTFEDKEGNCIPIAGYFKIFWVKDRV